MNNNFKIIETRTSKVIKLNNNVYKFKSATNTREQNNIWSCTFDSCRAFLKLNNDNTKIIETNEKHEHALSHRKTGEDKSPSNSGTPTNGTPTRTRTFTSSSSSSSEHDPKGTPLESPKNPSKNLNDKSTPLAVSDIRIFDSRSLLPTNQSIISVDTPVLNYTSTESTFNGTLQVTECTTDLKFQIQCLTQEIINKEMEIIRLKDKSTEDDKIIKQMIQTIRILEATQPDHSSKETYEPRKPNQSSLQKCISVAETSKGTPAVTDQRQRTLVGLFGDSHVRNLRTLLVKQLPHTYDIHAHFKPGGTLQEVANNLGEDNLKFDKICVIAGTNDVCHSTWTQVENAILQIRATFKDREIMYVLTPPRGEKSIMNKYIKIFNNNVKDLIKKLDNVSWIEVSYLLKYEDFVFDKIHLNRMGKIKLCKTICKHILRNKQKYKKRNDGINIKHISNKHVTPQNPNKNTHVHFDTSNLNTNKNMLYNVPPLHKTNYNFRQKHIPYKNKANQYSSTQTTRVQRLGYINTKNKKIAYGKKSNDNDGYLQIQNFAPPGYQNQFLSNNFVSPYYQHRNVNSDPYNYPYSIPIYNRYVPLQDNLNFHF